MKHVTGDLIQLALDGEFDVIVQGCNCFCAMGAGLAAQIRATFPQAYEADLATMKGDRSKLGSFTHVEVAVAGGKSLVVVNAYTQYRYGRGCMQFDYVALSEVLRKIRSSFPDRRIGMPRIGSDLAGGDWVRIESIIASEMDGVDVTVVTLPPSDYRRPAKPIERKPMTLKSRHVRHKPSRPS